MTKDIEREAFKLEMMDDYNMREVDTPFGKSFAMSSTNQAFKVWTMAKAHEAKKLEGCVVVPKDQIEVWWQDSEEPENFATKEDDLSFIAQHIEDDEIMKINEHHTIHLPSITKFGTWIYQSGQRKFFVGTKDEAEAARGGNE